MIASDIINRALRMLRIVDIDDTATALQLANGLAALNGFIDELNTETTPLYQEDEDVLTLTGAASYTIGSGGTFNVSRPQHILSAFYRSGTTDYPPMKIVSKTNFDWVFNKSLTGAQPEILWYEEDFPLGIIHLDPVPASGSLVMTSLKQLTQFAASSTTVSLPPGYSDMLIFNLAVKYSPEGGILTPEISKQAAITLMKLRRKNKKTVDADIQCPGQYARGNRGQILSGP
jgi:hypothetical protein